MRDGLGRMAAIVTRDDKGDVMMAWGRSDRSHNGAKGDDKGSDTVHFGRRCFAMCLVG